MAKNTAYNWERMHVDLGVWHPCTDAEKTNLQRPEFFGKYRFRPIKTGTPTKNSIVEKPKK